MLVSLQLMLQLSQVLKFKLTSQVESHSQMQQSPQLFTLPILQQQLISLNVQQVVESQMFLIQQLQALLKAAHLLVDALSMFHTQVFLVL